MITKELIDYIQPLLKQGLPKEEIRRILTNVGWQSNDIDAAFFVVENPDQKDIQVPPPVTVGSITPASTSPLTQLPHGLLGIAGICILGIVTYFLVGPIQAIVGMVFSLIGTLIFAGVARILKGARPVIPKSFFITGCGSIMVIVWIGITQIGSVAGYVSGIVVTLAAVVALVVNIVGGLYLTKVLYQIGWLRAVGLFFLAGLVNFLVAVVLVFSLMITMGSLFMFGLGSFMSGLSNMEHEQPALVDTEDVTGHTGLDDSNFPDAEWTPTPWKTITLGTYVSQEELKAAIISKGYEIGMFAEDLFIERAIPLESVMRSVTLVKMSTEDISTDDTTTLAAVYEFAYSKGLTLCPAEVGPQLLLQTMEDEDSYRATVAMKPLAMKDGSEDSGFTIFGVDYKGEIKNSSLDADLGSDSTELTGDFTYIFCQQ